MIGASANSKAVAQNKKLAGELKQKIRLSEQVIAEHGYRCRLAVIGEDGPGRAVDEALAASPDLLLVLAGDGTARLAAERCGPEGPLLAPLPGGTR